MATARRLADSLPNYRRFYGDFIRHGPVQLSGDGNWLVAMVLDVVDLTKTCVGHGTARGFVDSLKQSRGSPHRHSSSSSALWRVVSRVLDPYPLQSMYLDLDPAAHDRPAGAVTVRSLVRNPERHAIELDRAVRTKTSKAPGTLCTTSRAAPLGIQPAIAVLAKAPELDGRCVRTHELGCYRRDEIRCTRRDEIAYPIDPHLLLNTASKQTSLDFNLDDFCPQ